MGLNVEVELKNTEVAELYEAYRSAKLNLELALRREKLHIVAERGQEKKEQPQEA